MVLAHNDANMSLEEFLQFAESDPEHRYEYIGGQIHMMTDGSPDHSLISSNIGRILGNALRCGPRRVYNSDVYIQFISFSVVEAYEKTSFDDEYPEV